MWHLGRKTCCLTGMSLPRTEDQHLGKMKAHECSYPQDLSTEPLSLRSVREHWKTLPLIKATAQGVHTTSQLIRPQLGRAPLECSASWEGKVPHPMRMQGKGNATTHTVTHATQSSSFQSCFSKLWKSTRQFQLSSVSCKKLVSLWPCSPAAYIGSKRKGRQATTAGLFCFSILALTFPIPYWNSHPSGLWKNKINTFLRYYE